MRRAGRAAHWICRAAACCSICGSGRRRCRALALAPFAPPPRAPKLRISCGRRVSIPGHGSTPPRGRSAGIPQKSAARQIAGPPPLPPALSLFRVFGGGRRYRTSRPTADARGVSKPRYRRQILIDVGFFRWKSHNAQRAAHLIRYHTIESAPAWQGD